MELKPTRLEHFYSLKDDGGYEFHVLVSYTKEDGWKAYVEFRSPGMKTPEAAVDRLVASAENFIRIARAKDGR